MTFKGLIFDKDGTLFHFQESWGEWMSQIINELTTDSTRDRKMMAKACVCRITAEISAETTRN